MATVRLEIKPGDSVEVAMTKDVPPRVWLRLGSSAGEWAELTFSLYHWRKVVSEVGAFLAEKGLAAEMEKAKDGLVAGVKNAG